MISKTGKQERQFTMDKCKDCYQIIQSGQEYYCYWCGQPLCYRCKHIIDLPQHTQASCCAACWQEHYLAESGANDARLEIMINATFNGHDLSEWLLTEAEDGWQATCRRCRQTVWVGKKGLRYSLLEETCPG